MAEKIINSRIQLKTDTWLNWYNKPNFIPKKGEFIFYSDINKFKIGDGIKKISELDYVNKDEPDSIRFDIMWSGDNDSGWTMSYSGILSNITSWTGYNCITINLSGPEESSTTDSEIVRLYRQLDYDSPDNSGFGVTSYLGYNERDDKYYILCFTYYYTAFTDYWPFIYPFFQSKA